MQTNLPMVILHGSEHRFALANPPYEKFIGRKALGMTVDEVFKDGEVEIFKPILDDVYKTGKSFIGKELPIDLPDENGVIKNHFINIDYHAFKNNKGQIKGILAVVIDVTEQVSARNTIEKTMNALSIEKAKLDSLIAESPSAIGLMRGENLVFEIANTKWKELVSLDRDYIGKTYAEVYPELVDSEAMKSIQKTFKTGTPFTAHEMKLTVKTQAGVLENQYYDFTNVRVNDLNGIPYGVFCYCLNVTILVKNRNEVEETRKNLAISVVNLERERELRERFVLALTHDLRTPLTALKMSSQLLSRKPGDVQFVQTLSKRIGSSVERADRMIRDLLDANRIKAGEQIPLQIDLVNLVELTETTLAELNAIHEDRLCLTYENQAISGYWDKDALQRAIENLASNAIKYGSKGTPVTVKLIKSEHSVMLSIHNDGNPSPLKINKAFLVNSAGPAQQCQVAKSAGESASL